MVPVVTGFVGVREPGNSGAPVAGLEGKHGIERMLDSELEGVRGWSEIETDRRRREVVAFREYDVKPRDGLNVVLTLDANVQYIAEKAPNTWKRTSASQGNCGVTL